MELVGEGRAKRRGMMAAAPITKDMRTRGFTLGLGVWLLKSQVKKRRPQVLPIPSKARRAAGAIPDLLAREGT